MNELAQEIYDHQNQKAAGWVEVIRKNTTGNEQPWQKRTEIANENNPRFFITLHEQVDSSADKGDESHPS